MNLHHCTDRDPCLYAWIIYIYHYRQATAMPIPNIMPRPCPEYALSDIVPSVTAKSVLYGAYWEVVCSRSSVRYVRLIGGNGISIKPEESES